MKIEIAQVTLATKNMAVLKDFFAGILGEEVKVEDHEFYYTLTDQSNQGCIAVVPDNGDEKWSKPWITFATDDMPNALKRLKRLGASDIETCGPTDDDGNPTACVTFRDPDGRLMMLATSE